MKLRPPAAAVLLLLPMLAVVFALLLWPLCVLAWSSGHAAETGAATGTGGGGWSLANYRALITDSGYRTALTHSLVLSSVVAAFATAVCLGPAWFLAQHEFRGKRLVRAAFTLPMSLSGIMVGFLAILMLGRVGFVPKFSERLTGTQWLSGTAYQLTGLVIAYLYFEIPRGVLSLESSLRKFNPQLSEAAAGLGAGAGQRFRWIILPLIRPALLSTFALTFSVSLGSFGVALILSRRFSVLPLELFHQFTAMSNAPLAAAMAVTLAVIALTVQYLAHGIRREEGGA